MFGAVIPNWMILACVNRAIETGYGTKQMAGITNNGWTPLLVPFEFRHLIGVRTELATDTSAIHRLTPTTINHDRPRVHM